MRGFSERTLTVLNPLPNTTWRQLLDKVREVAGITERELFLEDLPGHKGPKLPFSHTWTYGGGAEEGAEAIVLAPGQRFGLRETEVRVFNGDASNKERGMAVIENFADKEEVNRKSIEALQRALEFYRIRGRVALNDVRRRSEVTEDQIKANLHFYLAYFINEARYQIVLDRVQELKTKRASKQVEQESAPAAG